MMINKDDKIMMIIKENKMIMGRKNELLCSKCRNTMEFVIIVNLSYLFQELLIKMRKE